jgi:hypothetical protein
LRLRNSFVLFLAVSFVSLVGCSKPEPPKQDFLDPGLAPLVPVDTTVMVGARIDRLAKTPVFDKLSQFGVVEQFALQTGIDPATRLYQLLWVSNGRRGVVLGRGKFTNGIIAPDLARKGGSESHYKGMTMFGDDTEAMLFLNASTALFGDTTMVKAIADQNRTGPPPVRLAALLPGIPYEAQVWGVYGGGPVNVTLPGNFANLQNVLKMLSNGMFYATFDTQAHITAVGVARSEDNARDLKGALEAVMALGKIAGDVTQQGTQVRVKADVPF